MNPTGNPSPPGDSFPNTPTAPTGPTPLTGTRPRPGTRSSRGARCPAPGTRLARGHRRDRRTVRPSVPGRLDGTGRRGGPARRGGRPRLPRPDARAAGDLPRPLRGGGRGSRRQPAGARGPRVRTRGDPADRRTEPHLRAVAPLRRPRRWFRAGEVEEAVHVTVVVAHGVQHGGPARGVPHRGLADEPEGVAQGEPGEAVAEITMEPLIGAEQQPAGVRVQPVRPDRQVERTAASLSEGSDPEDRRPQHAARHFAGCSRCHPFRGPTGPPGNRTAVPNRPGTWSNWHMEPARR